jgi:ribosome-associated toxin RatA of RatAB toxin-antitoxin module
MEGERMRHCQSSWEVKLRNGILRWTEHDEFDPDKLSVTFHQVDGDLAMLEGSWRIRESDGGAELSFNAQFDLGLPGLEDFLEPVAQKALEENIRELITRLFQGAAIVDDEIGHDSE